MRYTHEDELARLWGPAVRAMRPGRELMAWKAAQHAITQDGYINPNAILPGVGPMVAFGSASHTASSSNIVTYAEYLSVTITLPDGVWTFFGMGAISGSTSGSTNLNSVLALNGIQNNNFQIPTPGSEVATVFPSGTAAEVSGEVYLQVLYGPSAGTATVEAGMYIVRAERIR